MGAAKILRILMDQTFFSKILGQKTIKRVTVVDLDQNLVDQTFFTKLLDQKQPKF